MVNVIFILSVWLVYWIVQLFKKREPYMDIWEVTEGRKNVYEGRSKTEKK